MSGVRFDPRRRSEEPELMDRPDSDPIFLAHTLDQFRSINALLTRTHSLLKRHVLHPMQAEPGRLWTILDLGAGGGDLAVWLARRARRLGLRARITCLDHDPRATSYARAACRDWPEITVVEADVSVLPDREPFDFVFANHFLHHLPDAAVPGALALIARATRVRFVISDLARSRLGRFGYTLLARLFWRKSFALADGRLSVAKGFRIRELEEYCRAAGVEARVAAGFPFRVTVVGGEGRAALE